MHLVRLGREKSIDTDSTGLTNPMSPRHGLKVILKEGRQGIRIVRLQEHN